MTTHQQKTDGRMPLVRRTCLAIWGLLIIASCTNDLFETGNPLAPSAVMFVTPETSTIAAATTLTLTITGGVTPYQITDDVAASGTITGTGPTFTFSAGVAGTTYTVTVVDAEGTTDTAVVNVV